MDSLNQMDLQEWELLHDNEFLQVHEYDGVHKMANSTRYPDRVLIPAVLEPSIPRLQDQKLLKKEAVKIEIPPKEASEKIKSIETDKFMGHDQDPVSQVFFKKMKETEFVDMKMDSPKSSNNRGIIMPQEKVEPSESDPETEMKKNNMEMDLEESDEGGMNIWKWSLTRIGTVCSFGVAAACVCIIIFSSHSKSKPPQFQIYANDKRIKQVEQHSGELNEAISVTRGSTITWAGISFGGHYDAPL